MKFPFPCFLGTIRIKSDQNSPLELSSNLNKNTDNKEKQLFMGFS